MNAAPFVPSFQVPHYVLIPYRSCTSLKWCWLPGVSFFKSLRTQRLSSIGKSKGLNHHAKNQTNKQTKNEHHRSKNNTKLLEFKKKNKSSKCNENENLNWDWFLYNVFTSYFPSINVTEIYKMRTHLTIPLSLLSSWTPYASP